MSFLVETKRFKLMQTKQQAFNTDTVLLSNFINIPKNTKNILDIGTGSGVLMFDLAFKSEANIYGLEVQQNRFEQACNNIELNNLTNRLKALNEDLNEYKPNILFDLIISNPPFFKVDQNSNLSKNEEDLIARHEVKLTLEQLFNNVSRLLKYRGHFYMIHRPDRLGEIVAYANKYQIAIKTIRFIHPNIDSKANHILIHGIKNGGQGISVLNPLILYKDKHIFTKEMEEIIGDF